MKLNLGCEMTFGRACDTGDVSLGMSSHGEPFGFLDSFPLPIFHFIWSPHGRIGIQTPRGCVFVCAKGVAEWGCVHQMTTKWIVGSCLPSCLPSCPKCFQICYMWCREQSPSEHICFTYLLGLSEGTFSFPCGHLVDRWSSWTGGLLEEILISIVPNPGHFDYVIK